MVSASPAKVAVASGCVRRNDSAASLRGSSGATAKVSPRVRVSRNDRCAGPTARTVVSLLVRTVAWPKTGLV